MKAILSKVRSKARQMRESLARRRFLHQVRNDPGFHPVMASRAGGLGDELMALAALQAAARALPGKTFTLMARHAQVLQSDMAQVKVEPYPSPEAARGLFHLTYAPKSPMPIVGQMAVHLGLDPWQPYPIQLVRRGPGDLPEDYPAGGVTLVIQTVSSQWTPNKQWPPEHWVELLRLVSQEMAARPGLQVVEVGEHSALPPGFAMPHFTSLVGKTSLAQYLACVQQAGVFIGPPSSGIHIAHAYDVPAVVIVGGYEAANYPHPLATQLGSTIACSPCWLRDACPVDRQCLRDISAGLVKEAVWAALYLLRPASPPLCPGA